MKKYENFASALANLEDAPNQDLNNDFVQSGLINKFNLQFELSWKLLKRLLEYEGATLAASGSPRAILKESYRFERPYLRQQARSRFDSAHLERLYSRFLSVERRADETLRRASVGARRPVCLIP